MTVLEFSQDSNFIFECVFVFLGQFGFGDNFDGIGFVGLFMNAIFDNRKGSFSELPLFS